MKNAIRACMFAGVISILLLSVNCSNPVSPKPVYGQPVTDIDGNVYQTVVIGSQTWMAANLRTTKFSDGTAIPSSWNWLNLSAPLFCWFNNDSTTWSDRGALYNWHAVNTGKLAPAGWHVPTDSEWNTLISYLGGENAAASKLKEAGTTDWRANNTGATNETGFSAIPSSFRDYMGSYGNIEMDANAWLWSASSASDSTAWVRAIFDGVGPVSRQAINKGYCCSIRCVKD
jgi:uncharacterized protein (TIGR02145 family)